MNTNDLVERVALGAAAGLVGTLGLQVVRTANQQLIPETMPPIRQDPGEFMVEKAEELLPDETRADISETAETAAAKSLAMGYGMTAGALYAALRPDSGNVFVDGVALGLSTWAVGYLGWLPASGLMPPVTEHTREQVALSAAQHALFGVATAALYQWLHRRS
jgi:hypothetical protein